MDLNVVQVNQLDNKGGAARISYLLHKEYLKRKVFSHLLVGQKLSNEKEIEEIKGRYKNRLINMYSRIFHIKDVLPIYNTDFFSNPIYNNSTIVHLHNLHGGYFNLKNIVKISSQKPTIWTLHDMWAFTPNSPHTFECNRWIEGNDCNCGKHNGISTKVFEKILLDTKRRIYEESQFTVVTPSLWMKTNVEKSILKDKEIQVIYNGIDEKVFFPRDKVKARLKLNLPLDKKIICFVAHGGLKNQWKGGEYLKKAWEIIRKKKDVLLLEIGVEGDCIARENQHIKIPYVAEPNIMALYYCASDVFLFSSLAESSSLVSMEALACGVPVVSFDVGPLGEIVKDCENGFLARYVDSNDLAKKTLVLLEDDTIYKRLASNARGSILKSYTFEKEVNSYLKLYEKTINKN
ncbi:MAG: glycosyltransferase [Candidatus Dojkabacteria bacterium]